MSKGGSACYNSGGALGPGGGDREEGRCYCGRPLDMVDVHVTPTTGGQFQLRVAASDTVDYLRRLVSKRLRVPKERICLLYRDRHLREGTLEENNIMEGARITLLPSVETGLLTQRPEQSVMQALESLNDGQVNDFLSGKAPLNLTMRLGDHMMLIQLQLSTVSPTSSRKSSSRLSSSTSSHYDHHHHHHHHYHHHHHHYHSSSSSHSHTISSSCSSSHGSSPSSTHSHTGSSYTPYLPHHSSSNNIPGISLLSSSTSGSSSPITPPTHHPRASLSHSQPFFSPPPPHHHHYHHHHRSSTGSPHSTPSSPTSASPSGSPLSSPSSLCLDTDPPIRGCPHQSEESDPKASLDTKALAEASRNLTQTLKQLSSEVLTTKPGEKEEKQKQSSEKPTAGAAPVASTSTASGSQSTNGHVTAGRSSPTTASTHSSSSSSSKFKRQGAIIESMHQHGKGVYSGTFSGTLNPALQDRQGRPKRDISTIIHILNDLLCATPQYRKQSSSSHSSLFNSHSKHSLKSDNLASQTNEGQNNRADNHTEEDNSADVTQLTRNKMEQIKYKLEQRRARRKARREARSTPYSSIATATTSWSSEATTLVASATGNPTTPGSRTEPSTGQSMDVEGSESESSDQTTLCELNSGTVVA